MLSYIIQDFNFNNKYFPVDLKNSLSFFIKIHKIKEFKNYHILQEISTFLNFKVLNINRMKN